MEPTKVMSVRLPETLLRKTKVQAAQSGKKVQDVVREALEMYLKAHSRKEAR